MKRYFILCIAVINVLCFINLPLHAQQSFCQSNSWQNTSSKNQNPVSIVSTIAAIPYVLKKIFSPSTYRRSNHSQSSATAQKDKSPIYIQPNGVRTITDEEIEREVDLIPGPGTREEKWNRLVQERNSAQLEFQKTAMLA